MERFDGWLAYQSVSEDSCNHQGWKDVDGGITRRDGTNPRTPIALVEVQGLVYAAWVGCAELYREIGRIETAERLEEKADRLKTRFHESFWVKEGDFLALALEKGGRPLEVVTSNMGQALWTGIVDPEMSLPVSDHLINEHNFSGWGVRTLSTMEKAYCPIGYHTGGVWPHDNALIAAGLKRYGHIEKADLVIDAMIQAAFHFPLLRLPELFCGFPRQSHPVPVPYPTACSPQAWSAAAIPSMLATAVGLEADAFQNRLTLRKPRLPSTVPDLSLHGVRVGDSTIDLSFHRTNGHTAVSVDRLEGDCEVVVDPEIIGSLVS
jgi:glycogen debranching enzyme